MRISIVQGDDKVLTFTFKDAAGAAFNLTSYTVFYTVKKNLEDADAAALISGSLTVATPASGVGTWTLAAADTKYLLGEYFYDIQTKDGSGKIVTLIVDTFEVLPEVSKRTSA